MKITLSTNLEKLKKERQRVENMVKSGKINFKTGLRLIGTLLYCESLIEQLRKEK